MIAFTLGGAVWLVVFFGLLARAAWLATRTGWKPFLTAVALTLIAAALLAGAGVYLDHLGLPDQQRPYPTPILTPVRTAPGEVPS